LGTFKEIPNLVSFSLFTFLRSRDAKACGFFGLLRALSLKGLCFLIARPPSIGPTYMAELRSGSYPLF
tara:strand:+ start:123 stop:326 length:204 start_codon:yes stop_codon:yes gene_type:complete